MNAVAVVGLLFLAACNSSSITRSTVPGALNPDVTQANVHETVCRIGWTHTIRPPVTWSQPLKHQLAAAQGIRVQDAELDHLIPLNLGGAPRDPANLWLQRWDEARAKDDDELELYHAVCSGRITLEQAQRRILDKWGPR